MAIFRIFRGDTQPVLEIALGIRPDDGTDTSPAPFDLTGKTAVLRGKGSSPDAEAYELPLVVQSPATDGRVRHSFTVAEWTTLGQQLESGMNNLFVVVTTTATGDIQTIPNKSNGISMLILDRP